MPEPERYVFGIAGSREHYPDDDLYYAVEKMMKNHPDAMLVTGDAKGVDEAAIEQAKIHGLPYITEKAFWDTEGKVAGHNRNTRVVARITDTALAYFHPKPVVNLLETSPGTCDYVTQAFDRGLNVHARHVGRWLDSAQVQRIVDLTHQKWARLNPDILPGEADIDHQSRREADQREEELANGNPDD